MEENVQAGTEYSQKFNHDVGIIPVVGNPLQCAASATAENGFLMVSARGPAGACHAGMTDRNCGCVGSTLP
jgi:hypothetical protein